MSIAMLIKLAILRSSETKKPASADCEGDGRLLGALSVRGSMEQGGLGGS